MNIDEVQIFRAEILHFLADPAEVGDDISYEYFSDGLIIVKSGLVEAVGHAEKLLPRLPADASVTHYPNSLIVPGFIDCHLHYPQTEIIASYGEQLLEWLENYTFPTEREFGDPDKASDVAEFFFDELMRNGTTSALVFGTVHKQSVDAFFSAAQARRLRMICGKVLMDRNAPDYLTDTPESGYRESKELAERWHGIDRLRYAVTPRFAPTCSNEQLAMAGKLLKEYPDLYLHTHLAENSSEVEWVKELFPDRSSYLDVYAHHGLLTKRSIFAHCLHLNDDDFELLHKSGAGIAFCPTSNLFLGSGLFNLARAEKQKVKVGLATDIGAGTSFSLLQTISDLYKTQQLRNHRLTPFKSLYLATKGGALTLDLDDLIGNFEPGKEADFIVLDYHATPLLARRLKRCKTLTEKLFALQMLGDDRVVKNVHILGEEVYKK
ncbi:MAG: guanine deaminase [Desulfobulbaceae bacterium S3730MH12]|nr:MAG: guanine deaminase [Desulfobulbaceae bacterium S5133MH15]OEU55522.1 MAG: guanine deaminase [Desulfobulbaceae bacterium S3730MH12]OEU80841.1 MAG: guanine deaminase [Desulfobulbaceae bacterium C00003063]